MSLGKRRALITIHAFIFGYSITPPNNKDGCWRELEMGFWYGFLGEKNKLPHHSNTNGSEEGAGFMNQYDEDVLFTILLIVVPERIYCTLKEEA